MIRDSLGRDAKEACMEYQDGAPYLQYRNVTNAETFRTAASTTALPLWLRLVRSGSTLSGYWSSDGVTWTLVDSQTISMGTTVCIGLALCAHNATADTTGVFENISTTGAVTAVDSQMLTNKYLYGSYVDEPLALINSGGTFFCADNHVYSPAAMTDSSGVVQERYRYDSYGNRTILCPDDSVKTVQASAIGSQRGFTGYYGDPESGLYYARARMYSPVLGRFIGRDPGLELDEKTVRHISTSPQTMPFERMPNWNQVQVPHPYRGTGYQDGMSLYGACYVPSGDDPSGTVDLSDFGKLPPLPPPATSGNPYPNEGPHSTYDLINANSMYNHGGNTDWGNIVRNCLVCALKKGASQKEAHTFCYDIASQRTGFFTGWGGYFYAVSAAIVIGAGQLAVGTGHCISEAAKTADKGYFLTP